LIISHTHCTAEHQSCLCASYSCVTYMDSHFNNILPLPVWPTVLAFEKCLSNHLKPSFFLQFILNYLNVASTVRHVFLKRPVGRWLHSTLFKVDHTQHIVFFLPQILPSTTILAVASKR